jgi:hypothetical protein
LKSKKALFEALDGYFGTDRFTKDKLNAAGISNETYGRMSCVYVNCDDKEVRKNVEGFLSARGFKVNRDYDQGGKRIEVQVSYFRGEQWNV